MSYDTQFYTGKVGGYPVIVTAPPTVPPSAPPATVGQQIDGNLQMIAWQTEDIKAKELALIDSLKNCEEREKIVIKQLDKLKEQVIILKEDRTKSTKKLVAVASPPLTETIAKTGEMIKQHWLKAFLISVPLLVGAAWIYHKSKSKGCCQTYYYDW